MTTLPNPAEPCECRIPVCIVTGFLGSGKTTLINRLPGASHGTRIVVIGNASGEAAIDSSWRVHGDAHTVDVHHGVICCTATGNLAGILGTLARRRDAGDISFDRVVIETPGLANPALAARTFSADQAVACYYRLDAIVTLVDAFHAAQQFDAFHAAREQVRCADRMLLSKTDLVTPAALHALVMRLQQMNARAPVTTVHYGHTDFRQLLDIDAFSPDAIRAAVPNFPAHAAQPQSQQQPQQQQQQPHGDISSFAYQACRPFRAGSLEAVMAEFFQHYANDMLRYKGVLDVAGLPARTVFQGMHMLMHARGGQPWRVGETRASSMVFIGRNLPRERFRARLEECLVTVPARAAISVI
ncbi:MAG: GTP-binding protein [Pseudomonadota bacterium]|nr:GTP-binding protein [Pseudomonadota bacterium]